MSIDDSTFLNWLEERFRFDALARNRRIEIQVKQYLADKTYIHLLDLGAGNGGNACFFFDRFPQDQKWVLLEKDPYLAHRALDRLSDYGATIGYKSTRVGPTLRLHTLEKTVDIEVVNGDIMQLDALVDLLSFDLVMANALFDLFSIRQFESLVTSLSPYKLPLYATINYTGMRFIPKEVHDMQVVTWYEGHMVRPRPEGKAMGPECMGMMAKVLKKYNYQIETGDSSWQINADDHRLKKMLLAFMDEAIHDWLENEDDEYYFRHWLHKAQSNLRWRAEIEHEDVYAFF